MGKKYHTLRTISMILKVLAWVVAIFTVIFFIVVLAGISFLPGPYAQGVGFGFISAFSVLVYGAISFIVIYAFAEIIIVLLAIEENTRKLKVD